MTTLSDGRWFKHILAYKKASNSKELINLFDKLFFSIEEMEDEEFTTDDVVNALIKGRVLEVYPEHKRGACCLVVGEAVDKRSIHVVCTMDNPVLIVITVYEPKPPKFLTPDKRSK